jgi:hypothetical protein
VLIAFLSMVLLLAIFIVCAAGASALINKFNHQEEAKP